jgi:hypothetical protein
MSVWNKAQKSKKGKFFPPFSLREKKEKEGEGQKSGTLVRNLKKQITNQ